MKSLLFLLISASALAVEPNQVQVQGNCQIKVVPDRGTIAFTAENQFKDQKEAVKKTNDQINSLKKEIEGLKLADLQFKNTNYSVQPIRDYEKNRYVDKGTRASLTLEVTTSDIARIGETLVHASKIGVAHVGSLQTFLSQEKSQREYLKCLDVAAEDARKKAQQLAKKLNFKIGEVIKLIESPLIQATPPQPPMPMMKGMSMAADSMAPTQIEAGDQEFSTTLQISFAIK